MIIELAPDYDLFVKIFFAYWMLSGILHVIAGISQTDKPKRDEYGIIEIMDGGLVLMLGLWVIT